MSLRLSHALWLAGALAVLHGCGSTPGLKPAELTEFKPTAELKPLWQGGVESAEKYVFFPRAVGNVVYAVGAEGSVTAFDKARGTATHMQRRGARLGRCRRGRRSVPPGTLRAGYRVRPRGTAVAGAAYSEVLAPPEARKVSSWRAPALDIYGWTRHREESVGLSAVNAPLSVRTIPAW
jgi:hypothetical protein